MKKTYCDICKKEIVKDNETWSYGLMASNGNPRVSFDEDIKEICEECATILHCCTSMMKNGKHPNFNN